MFDKGRIKKTSVFLMAWLFLSLILFSAKAFTYETEEGGHIGLTRKALNLKINLHQGDNLASELNQNFNRIINANVAEDAPFGGDVPFQYFLHFYNPQTKKGLFGFPNAKDRAIDFYNTAKDLYCKGKKQDAWDKLGHALHLLQDMAQPSHTHMTGTHAFPTILGMKKGYEAYVRDNWNNKGWSENGSINDFLNISSLQNKQLSNVGGYIDYLAMKSYLYPWDEDPYYLTNLQMRLNAENLLPPAIEYGAGLINTFWEDVQKEKCVPQQPGPGGDHPDETFDVSEGIYLDSNYGVKESDYFDFNIRLGIKKGKIGLYLTKVYTEKVDEFLRLIDTTPEDQLQTLKNEIYALEDKLSGYPSTVEEDLKISPDIGVITNGYFDAFSFLMAKFKEPVNFTDVNFPPEIIKHKPILLIPSGGLYGLENSTFFKASLDEYVKQGGTLLVFAQQHGYEFSVLPIPQEADGTFKTVTGYGWTEDQSCFTNAVYIDTWHQALSGQSRSTPTLNVDGYFTNYPSNATVILRRTVNGQPAMISYPYGNGIVIVTSMYSDWAYGHSQASKEEIALVRDIISWAKKPAQLPEIKPGETVTMSVTVQNNTTTDAASVKLTLVDADRNIITEQTVSASVPAGSSTQLTTQYPTLTTAPLGIYHIDYTLLDAQGNTIQPQAETDSGRFAVSNPPSNPYKSPDFSFAINTDSEQYAYGSDAVFTVTIWNNTDLPHTIKFKYGSWHINLWGEYTIEVPARSSSSFNLSAHDIKWQGWLYGTFYDEAGKAVGSGQKGIWMFQPSVDVALQTDKTFYAKGETVNLTLNLQNKQAASYTANLRVRVADPLNSDIYINTIPVTLAANGTLTQSLSFVLPSIPKLGFYTASAEIYDATGRKIGGDSAGFELPKTQIAVVPNISTPLVFGANNIPFSVNNTGRISVSSGILDISLKDPDGAVLYSGNQSFALGVGQNTTLNFSVTIPNLKFGNYTLTYRQSDETRTGGTATHNIPNAATIKLALDKPSYGVREAAGLTVDLANTGKFNLDTLTLSVSVPEAGYADTKTILLSIGATSQFTYLIPIPATVLPGQHDVNVTLTLPSGSSIVQTAKLSVPESDLFITGPAATQFAAGDVINLTVENNGGVDTSYTTEKLAITDNKGVAIYQGSITGTIMAGEKKTLIDIQVPLQAVNGEASLDVRIKNGRTLMLLSLNKSIDVSGLTASLQTKTVKDLYIKTEEIASLSGISNGQYGIDGGSLKIAISRIKSTGTGQFTHFLPKEGWGYMQEPHGVGVASDGSVYVADTNNNRIQKFDSNGNFITKWGSWGSGDGQFYYPYGIAIGSDDSVYVADTNNNRIQKFDSNGNFITKWGGYGSGDGQFNYPPGGIAVAPDGSVYVADTNNNRIQKFDRNGNFITKWGSQGSGNGQFYYPYGIAAGPDGSIYVADTGNNRIQKFDSNGNFIAKWGSYGISNGQFKGSYGVAVASDGSVYVTDNNNNRIQKFDSNGSFITKWGSYGSDNGQFLWPSSIAVGTDGSVYVADRGNARIQKFNSEGGFVTKWGNNYCMTDTNGDRLPDKPCIGEFYYPYGIAIGSDGSVYVADTYNNHIQKFDSNGNFITKWGNYGAGNGQFSYPYGIAVAPDGSVYVTDTGNYRIQKFDSNGNFIIKWGSRGSGNGQFYMAWGIAIAQDGSVYVVDTGAGNRRIQKFDSNGNFITRWGWYQWQGPYGVAATPDGYVYVGDWNHRVYKFGSNGGYIKEWGGYCESDLNKDGVTDQACEGKFYYPLGIAGATDNSVYVADTNNNRIQMFDSNGSFIAKWGSYGRDGEGKFNSPYGISIGSDGSVYVADTSNHRIQRMIPQIAGSETLFETTVSITQSANTMQDYITNIGALNTSGKLYLQAKMTNSLGQTIAISEHSFYVVEGNTVLIFNADKKYYKPGETVTITGEVKNLATVSLDNATLLLDAGTSTLINQAITVPAGGSYPFSVATTAGSEAKVTLTGKVNQNNSTLVEITDQYEVAKPSVSVVVTAPNVVGHEPFEMSVEMKNTGKVEATLQFGVQSSGFGDSQTMTIPAGETKVLQYVQQIANSTTYTFTFSGDLEQNLSKTVVYGEAATVTIGSGVMDQGASVYPEGKAGIPVTVTNTGQIDEMLEVNFQLSSGSGVQSSEIKTYYIPRGGSITDALYFDLTKGDYQLTATSQLPTVSAQATFKVAKENEVAMTVASGQQSVDGSIPVTVSLTNNGYNTIDGSIQLSVVKGQNGVVWTGEAEVTNLLSQASSDYVVNVDPAGVIPGDYILRAELLNNSNQQIAVSSQPLAIRGAAFQITQLPAYSTFTAGAEGSFTFTVKNTGNQEGEMSFSLKAMDVLDQTVIEWLMPGEEKTITFNFLLPDDVEEKDYFADYQMTENRSQKTDKGQVKYHVAGINLTVNATLDKQSYNVGETAHLMLQITDNRAQKTDINLFARVNYAGYENQQTFTLNGSQTLTFDIPLTEITGEKLFYGIYHEGGRSIHLNSLYIYKAGDAITITTDKQVYNPGETVSVSVSVNSVSGTTGTMTLAAPNYTETFGFTGSAAKSIVLPVTMTAGTYYINYELSTGGQSPPYTGSHPIDVAGISVKVKEASLDKAKYAATDTINLSLTVESNQNLSATLKTWIVDPDGSYTSTGTQGVSLTSAEPLLATHNAQLATDKMGIHRLVYGIYLGDLLLSSGSEAFDVGDAVLLGVATDKADYPDGNETVQVTSSLFGTVSGTLEYFIDGISIKTDSINLSGFTSYTFDLSSSALSPGAHTLKAVLTAGGLSSTKEAGFAYGSSLPDLVVTVGSRQEAVSSTIQITATVINQGKTVSAATDAAIYDGGSLIATLSVPTLNPGESADVSYNWNVLGKAGSRTIIAIADAGNHVREFNETNNTASYSISIPDVVLDLSTSEDAYSAGDVISIEGFATNLSAGMTYAPAQAATTVADSMGAEVFRDTASIDLTPMSVISVSSAWDTKGASLGAYTITRALSYNQQALASAQKIIFINNTIPSCQILLPAGGETISGRYTVKWQAQDVDAHTLSIDIAYSRDSGGTWLYAATNEANDGAYEWDTASLPDGSNYKLRLIAKDGVATSACESGIFTLLNTGALKINSQPSGARVYIDGNYAYPGTYYGATGINISQIRSGKHIVRLAYPGYSDHYELIEVAPGAETQLMINLKPLAQVSYTEGARLTNMGAAIDAGSYSAPFVVDWNMDGKKDVVIGNGDGQAVYYENTGTNDAPAFDAAPVALFSGSQYIAPFIVDWDNDGRYDFIAGNGSGEVIYYKNTGNGIMPSLEQGVVIAKVDSSAIPFVIDWNEDNKKDLLIGAGDGTLNLSINQGMDSQPAFNANPDAVVLSYGSVLSPFVVTDWNGDAKKDIIAGNSDGGIYLYLNQGTHTAPSFGAGEIVVGSTGPINAGANSTPFIIDFNNDGLMDIVTGNASGEIYLFIASEALIPATIDIDPDILNKKSKGRWVTCYIELPTEYRVEDIDINSLLLQGVIPAEAQPVTIDDYDTDGIRDLMVKFDRQRLQSLLNTGDNIKVILTGRLKNGKNIRGEDYIRVTE